MRLLKEGEVSSEIILNILVEFFATNDRVTKHISFYYVTHPECL